MQDLLLLQNLASALQQPRILGPGDRSRWGAPRPPAGSGALARPVQLQARGLSALGRALTAGRRARDAGP